MVNIVSEVQCTKDASGKWVNQYQLLQDLGQGTFSTVKLATTSQGSTHAIKCFARRALEHRMVAHYDADGPIQVPFRECIEKEIRILSELQHPHVVRLEEVIDCLSHDSVYLVYEGLPGRELMVWNEGSVAFSASAQAPVQDYWGDAVCAGDYILDTKQREVLVFQEELVRFFCCQLTDGLTFIHDRGVIHKDLKPPNLVLSKPIPVRDARFVSALSLSQWPTLLPPTTEAPAKRDSQTLHELLASAALSVKIADFGSAEACQEPDFLIYDAQGTQQFTPPECFDGQVSIKGKPRDMWSLGCVLFVLAFGQCPFWAESNFELQLKIIQRELTFPEGGPGSHEFRQLVAGLLSQDPTARPSARALRQSPWLTSPRDRKSVV